MSTIQKAWIRTYPTKFAAYEYTWELLLICRIRPRGSVSAVTEQDEIKRTRRGLTPPQTFGIIVRGKIIGGVWDLLGLEDAKNIFWFT